ncbi:MAG: DUF3131 domain-containing protein [Methylococcales bacterium]
MKKSIVFYSRLTKTALCLVFVTGCSHFPGSSPLAPLLEVNPQVSHPPKDLIVNNKSQGRHTGRNGTLTTQEMGMARIAWQYFEKNYQQNTGLVNAANEFPSTTMWDVGSYLGALVSAHELGVIDKATFDTRLSKLLQTFNTLSLFRNLPHKVYNTQTLEKVTYANKSGEIGFSALDLGRLLIWLKIIKERYPEYSNAIDSFVIRWDFTQLIDSKGNIYGASREDATGNINRVQEGRLGYEEYAAKGFDLWGFTTTEAAKAEPYDSVQIYGIDIPYDARNPRQYYTRNPVVSESYLLDALEFNWDLANDTSSDDMHHSHPWMATIAQKIYDVQEARYKQTGILTARTEHQLDQKPYFVYDCIYSDGQPWATITEKGEFVPQFAAVALKGALGLWAVWKTDYTDLLFAQFSNVYDPEQGFYEGKYENGSGVIKKFSANNNGVILEALLYKVQGKLLRFSGRSSAWDKSRNTVPSQ